jgi:transposase-like protein
MDVSPVDTMSGIIVSDEAYIGGSPGKMNKSTRARLGKVRNTPGSGITSGTAKTPIVALINAETGEVRSQVVPKVTAATLHKFMSQNVDISGSVLWTDESNLYTTLGYQFRRHETVNHSADEYVGRNDQTINQAENFLFAVQEVAGRNFSPRLQGTPEQALDRVRFQVQHSQDERCRPYGSPHGAGRGSPVDVSPGNGGLTSS